MTILKKVILLLLFWSIPSLILGQEGQPENAQTQAKPKVNFSQNINQSNSELRWSKTYYRSFQKTKEAVYLNLAAKHCANAIKVLMATQAGFPNTTTFHYKAKNRRFDACQYFEKLQETALRLGPDYHIKGLANEVCDF